MAESDHDLLIQLNAKTDSILETLKQIPALEQRVRVLETDSASEKSEMKTVKGEVDKLRNSNTAWSFINSIGVIIASILGISIK